MYERTNASELRESLEELVELKDYKDVHGKDGYYLTRQPIAWARARNAIENSKILEENEKRNKSEHSGD